MSWFVKRYDLPLTHDSAGRYLPWIIAFMVYLALLALTCAMTIHGLISSWKESVAGTLTVQIIPPPHAVDALEMAQKLQKALEILRAEPAVIAAEPLDQNELYALLEPWLGKQLPQAETIPLPRLIDVVLHSEIPFDLVKTRERLSAIVPEAELDDHKVWLGDLIDFARSIQFIALLVVSLVGLAGMFVVMFATRAGFSIHIHIIEVLHLIGAQDNYITNQFQSYALSLGIRGGMIGLILAALTLTGLAILARRVDETLLPSLPFHPLMLLVLLIIPITAAIITMVTANLTVKRSLTRMM